MSTDGPEFSDGPELLPLPRLDLTLAQGPTPDARRVTLEGRGAWADRLRELALD